MTYNVHLTLKSRNAKTGPIPVSMTTALTCNPNCPFNGGNGCYAASGPLAIHWGNVNKGLAGMPWAEFTAAIAALPAGTLWRHNQAGDLPGKGGRIDKRLLRALVRANRGRKGFTYTHKDDTAENLAEIRAANAEGFVINLSANNLAHADRLADHAAGPVVVVLPSDQTTNTVTPAGRKVVVCPATVRDDIACIDCGLCARADRQAIIGFPGHGSGAAKVSAIAAQ